MPDEFLVSCMMAVGILGHSHLEYGVTSSVVVAGMSWLLPAIGGESFSASAGFSQSLFVLLALLVLSAVVGGFVRQGRRQTELIDMVQRRTMNLEIAHMRMTISPMMLRMLCCYFSGRSAVIPRAYPRRLVVLMMLRIIHVPLLIGLMMRVVLTG
ncbi:hypothetical protein [Bifidobacterium merycicum]|uniref:hypothetical protein n=1 Tax=Bifidobacterium merycicum TaxID=78345 RepID=UPI00116091ED|nr:hypothetical protein [Bifidobacterium merycicum]